MSPFDLPGPLFLVFYFFCGAVALTGLAALQAWAEPRSSVKVNFSDPYLIAFLRGGKNQTLRTATVSLIDRALIKVSGSKISAVGINASNGVRVALEYELLRYCKTPVEAASVYSVHAFDHFMQDYERELVRLGLMPDESAKAARWKRLGVVQALLSGIAITKIALAIERGHKNIGFLIVLALTVAAVAYRIGNPRLTGKGKALLDDLRLLLSSLRARATGFQPGANSNELALLAAAFGVDALPTSVFPHAKTLFPKAAGSSSGSCGSCGSSCGSSCGGGGCGGGCGGCGS